MNQDLETYTTRRTEPFTVKGLTVHESSISILTTDSTGFNIPLTVETIQIREGGTYLLELKNFNDIGGILLEPGHYLFRRTDQYFDRRHEQFLADSARRRREALAANRDDWKARQEALPLWIRRRLEHFHAVGGEHFALHGWGYELIICELATIYERNGLVDDDEVTRFASLHGTSGNQHDCARALARHKDQVAAIPAGLAPLTGDADYSAGGKQTGQESDR